jgi:hypothetical protein
MTRRIIGGYLAKSACAYFKVVKEADKTVFDTLTELGEAEEQELGNGKFKYTLGDEHGKININKASIDVLSRLPGFSKEAANNLFISKSKPFHVVEEILLVEEVSEEMFGKCKDLITIYGDGSVNINTASEQAFRVLGFDDGLINIVMDFRSGTDGKSGTEDDGIFEDKALIVEQLRAHTSLYEEQEAKLLQLVSQGMLSVFSDTYSMNIETTVLEKPAMRYNIVLEKGSIKRWNEI